MGSNNVSVPYKKIFEGGLYSGKIIQIQGEVSPQAHRFTFDLLYRGGIAFHYNARFDENTVVRNSLTGNGWGSEERCGPMPFVRGQRFEADIACEDSQFKVKINGDQVHTYKHRITSLAEIDCLEIFGDLSLTAVEV